MAEPLKIPEEHLDLLEGINLPDGVRIESFWDSLVITREWYAAKYLIMAVGALFWNVFVIANMGAWMFFTPFGWVGVWLGYYAVTHIFNSTTINISATEVTVSHHPIPYPGNKKLPAGNIRQLYVVANRNRDGETYEVRVVTNRHKELVLITGIDQMVHALIIEYVIEQFLEIEDEPVLGEIKADEKGYALNWKAWEEFAQNNQLRFSSGRLLEANGVYGVYRGNRLKLSPQRDPISTVMMLTNGNLTDEDEKQAVTPSIVEALFNVKSLKGKIFFKNGGSKIIPPVNKCVLG